MMYEYRGGPRINYAKCTGCQNCYDVCPPDIFSFDKRTKQVSVSYPEECWYCGSCLYDCPAEGAIELELPLACA
jgi:NAD-dependent dihydropyrimidine dehydrogenase PreA subunit